MSRKKKLDDIYVESLGTSTNQVTGSCWSVSYVDDNFERQLVIIECGLPQGGNNKKETYNAMKRVYNTLVNGNYVKEAKCVVTCHSHVDHVGMLALFNENNGFKGKIIGSRECLEISKELIKDCCHIHHKDIEYLKSKGDKVKEIYSEVDMYSMFNHMENVPVGEEVIIDDNLKIEYRYNSHTLGSCNITLKIRKPSNNRWYKIVYSSDMGNRLNYKFSHYLKEQDIPTKCDLFISEATYSAKSKELTNKDVINEREELIKIIKNTLLNNGRVLIPTFAFSRSQAIATFLYEELKDEEWFKPFKVIMDGNLMGNINSVYSRVLEGDDKALFEEVMNWSQLRKITDYKATMSYLSTHTPAIILASSGFMEQGKVMTYLPPVVGCSKDTIITVGYCSQNVEGSMGYKLLNDNVKRIEFPTDKKSEKKVINKNCKIYEQMTWSSHISHQEILDLASEVNCDRLVFHHCDEDNKDSFKKEVNEYLRNKNKTTKVIFTSECSSIFKI